MSLLVEVLKPRRYNGIDHQRGEIVDASRWPKLTSAVRAGLVRYHVPLADLDQRTAMPSTEASAEASADRPAEEVAAHAAEPAPAASATTRKPTAKEKAHGARKATR